MSAIINPPCREGGDQLLNNAVPDPDTELFPLYFLMETFRRYDSTIGVTMVLLYLRKGESGLALRCGNSLQQNLFPHLRDIRNVIAHSSGIDVSSHLRFQETMPIQMTAEMKVDFCYEKDAKVLKFLIARFARD
ncbi:hypothetical protein TNIN_247261 [Trichonephila inaurata madagascariensis]|uniref:Uncharacterized protein n=1 Tax=Trichonephila inaurata madagascariensis TaxID=2747483 RepID=A0A8X6XXB7_9ARAC|nr:hypothetical protein TNIN_247261 [Trichonephila inaurata madagascariensis]